MFVELICVCYALSFILASIILIGVLLKRKKPPKQKKHQNNDIEVGFWCFFPWFFH